MVFKSLFGCGCLQAPDESDDSSMEEHIYPRHSRKSPKIRTPNRIRVKALGSAGLSKDLLIDWDNEEMTVTETELLFSGFARRFSPQPVPSDLISVFSKFWSLIDKWSSKKMDFGLQIHGEYSDRIKMMNKSQQLINYAFGERTIDIDPTSSVNKRTVWKLKLRAKKRSSHVCCGIGIIDVRNMKAVHHRNLKMVSSNFPQILNAKKTEYRHLIGFQCGTFNEYTEEEEPSFRHLLELGLIIIRRRWKQNGHCINDASAPKKLKQNENGWTNSNCCFMHGDHVTVSVDHSKLRLDLFINDKNKAKYSKSIKHIKPGQYKLCVWLLFHKQSIEIVP